MKHLIVFIWAFILGQVVCYIGGALTSGQYDFVKSTIISLIVGLIVILIGYVITPHADNQQTQKN